MPDDERQVAWVLEEAESFRLSFFECGERLDVENGIFPIRFGLKQDPYAFLQTGVFDSAGKQIYLAKTKLDLSGAEIIYSYSVRYVINEDLGIVVLLHVGRTDPDDIVDDDPAVRY